MPCNGRAVQRQCRSAAPRKNGKATNSVPDQTKPKKKVYQENPIFQKPKELVWAIKNNSSGEVVAKYVGKETNIYRHTSIWVSKIFVTNMQGPKSNWGPKSSN